MWRNNIYSAEALAACFLRRPIVKSWGKMGSVAHLPWYLVLASTSNWLSWRTDQSTALRLATYSRVSPVSPTWQDDGCGLQPPIVPPVRLSTVGKRAFAVAGANMWNDLPFHITSAQSLVVFRQRLKTFLFSRFYPDILIWLTYHYWLVSLFFFLFLLAFPVGLAIIDIIQTTLNMSMMMNMMM